MTNHPHRSVSQKCRSPSKIARSGNAAAAGSKIPLLLQKGAPTTAKKRGAAKRFILEQDFFPMPPPSTEIQRRVSGKSHLRRETAGTEQSSAGIPSKDGSSFHLYSTAVSNSGTRNGNAKLKLSPRGSKGFNFKPEEPSNHP